MEAAALHVRYLIAMRNVTLLIGTRKGAFLAAADADRKSWTLKGPLLKGSEVHYVTYLPKTSTLVATVKSWWFGCGVQMSTDRGETWVEPERGIRFDESRGKTVERIWIVREGADALYAGVDPGALFRSRDNGQTWDEVPSLTDHPTREKWFPGAGGLMVHSICPDAIDPKRVFVGISAAGVFRTDDGGESWTPKNQGVRADFLPDKFPLVGQCVHHLEQHPSKRDILYQQNHCGVYRTEDAGDTWIDISESLPSRFGFPIVVDPNDGDTIFVVPEEGSEARMTPGGLFGVYRSKNRGTTWQRLTEGLPQSNSFPHIYRASACADSQSGVYLGTQGGHLLASRNGGDSWETIFDMLPPIYSLQAAQLE
jgi:photosystem II stability/assembly factor-like uncharacterized protein